MDAESVLAWLAEQNPAKFPQSGGATYPTRFRYVSEYLDKDVHPHVEKEALLRGDGYLTDHGPDHVRRVIQRAFQLMGGPSVLSPYEVYVLLMAVHAHDVGNMFGRPEHEKRAAEVLQRVAEFMTDSAESKIIRIIAAAHGGQLPDGSKDTISQLAETEYLFDFPVRVRALAAILRFADELADDTSRAARFPLKLGTVPTESEVFHAYADRLNSVTIDRNALSVTLRFFAATGDAIRTFGKGNKQVYLLDEIHARTAKMHAERIYCSRFMRNLVEIDEINVKVTFYDAQDTSPSQVIQYTLRERGYPKPPRRFVDLCPDARIDGPRLARRLRKRKTCTK